MAHLWGTEADEWLARTAALRRSKFVVRAASRTTGADRLAELRDGGVPFAATGVCPDCQCRVPLLGDGTPARHWPHKEGKVRMVVPRRPADHPTLSMTITCAGAEFHVAGLIVIDIYT